MNITVGSTVQQCFIGLKGQGTWFKFVRNRTKSIQDKESWHLAKWGSWGFGDQSGYVFFKWLWLSAQHKWPNQSKVSKSPENDKEIVKPKHEKQPLVKEQKQRQRIRDQNLLLVATFLRRFINNFRKLNRQKGPLKTKELHAAETFWVIQAQASKSEKWLKKGREGSIEMC